MKNEQVKRVLKGNRVAAPATTKTFASFENVNNQRAIGIVPIFANTSVSVANDVKISIAVGGTENLEEVSLLNYYYTTRLAKPVWIDIAENAKVNVIIDNPNVASADVNFMLIYAPLFPCCSRPKLADPNLLVQGTSEVVTTGAGTFTTNKLVDIGRGDISSVRVVTTNSLNTIEADLIDLVVDGTFVFQDVPVAIANLGSTWFNFHLPMIAKEGAKVAMTVVNNSGSATDYQFIFGYNGR